MEEMTPNRVLKGLISSAVWIWGLGIAATAVATAVAAASNPLYSFWGGQSGGDQLNFAVYLAHGKNYFTNPDTYPMLTPQTPGLFVLLLVAPVMVLGPALLYGNLLGAFALCVVLGAAAYTAHLISETPLAIPLVWVLLLDMRRVGDVFSWNRPDSVAAALAAVAIALLARYEVACKTAVRSFRYLLLAALFGVLATYTKQLAIAVPVATVLYLVITKRRRDLTLYSCTVAACAIPPLLVAQTLTGGGFLYNVWTLTRGMTLFSAEHWIRNVTLYLLGNCLSLLLLASAVVGIFRAKARTPQTLLMIVFVSSVVLLFGVSTCWHMGGSLNYFACASVGLAMAGAVVTARAGNGNGRRSILALFAVLLWVSAGQRVFFHLLPWETLREDWTVPWNVRPPNLSRTQRVFRETAALSGEVLFDRLPGLAVLQGRPVDIEPSALSILKSKRLWNPSLLGSDLKRGRWNYVAALNLTPGRRYVFFGDSDLDAIFQREYHKIRSYPLEGTSYMQTPVIEIYALLPRPTSL